MFDHYRRGYNVVHVRDIRNTLLAVHAASRRAGRISSSPEAAAFREGFAAALEAVATAFGLDPLLPTVEPTRLQPPVIVDVTSGSG